MILHLRSFVITVFLAAMFIAAPVRSIVPPVAAQTGQQREAGERGNPSAKVWVNTRSGVYHCPGTRYYGTTKNGQYMTQADAQQQAIGPRMASIAVSLRRVVNPVGQTGGCRTALRQRPVGRQNLD